MSHSCRMSGLVQGTRTSRRSSLEGDGVAERDIRVRSEQISWRDRERPIAALMYEEEAVVARGSRGGVMWEVPSGM